MTENHVVTQSRLLTLDVLNMGKMSAGAVSRLLKRRLRQQNIEFEWVHAVAEDGLSKLKVEDYDWVWLYASNVVQVTGRDALMTFLHRFRESGVHIVAAYAWIPEGFNMDELFQLGVSTISCPMEPDELISLFELGKDITP